MSDEPLSKNPIWSRSVEGQMIVFRKNHEHYLQYKGNSAKVHEKNDPFFHQSLSIKLT